VFKHNFQPLAAFGKSFGWALALLGRGAVGGAGPVRRYAGTQQPEAEARGA